MRLLWVTVQYPRAASTLEPRRAEVAGGATIPEGMEEMSDGSTPWKVRGGLLWSGFKQADISRHVDHIVPARLIRRLKAGNPDRRENLQCICGTCHGYKLQADHKLCLGNKLGYLEILRTHNFDLARVERALSLYNL